MVVYWLDTAYRLQARCYGERSDMVLFSYCRIIILCSYNNLIVDTDIPL
jgi:hypothetical protein